MKKEKSNDAGFAENNGEVKNFALVADQAKPGAALDATPVSSSYSQDPKSKGRDPITSGERDVSQAISSIVALIEDFTNGGADATSVVGRLSSIVAGTVPLMKMKIEDLVVAIATGLVVNSGGPATLPPHMRAKIEEISGRIDANGNGKLDFLEIASILTVFDEFGVNGETPPRKSQGVIKVILQIASTVGTVISTALKIFRMFKK